MRKKFLHRKLIKIIVLLSTLSLMLSLGIYYYGVYNDNKNSYNEFINDSQELTKKINLNFEKYDTVLRGLQAFFVVNPNVPHKEFKRYIDSLDIIKNYPGFVALNYAIYVKENEKDIEFLKLRKDIEVYLNNNIFLLNDVNKSINKNIKELGPNKEYFIVKYVEPIENNAFTIGKDLGNKPEIYKAINETRKTGIFIPSGKLFVFTNNKKKNIKSIGLRLPVYENMLEKINYRGTVGAAIDFEKIINLSMEEQKKKFNFKIFTKNYIDNKDNLIFESQEKLLNENKFLSEILLFKSSFNIKTKKFDIYISPENNLTYNKIHIIWLGYAILSFIVFLLIEIVIYSLFSSKERAVKIAALMTKDLQYMAWYDSLTGAINRAKLLLMINERVETSAEPFMLFFIDLDGFKRINDTLGHHWGDIVLKEYCTRFKDILKDKNQTQLARVGGDEFVILVPGIENMENWITLINNVIADIFIVNDYKFSLGQSIGVASYPKDGKDSETLLRKADIAMYYAKKSEHQKYMVYSDSFGEVLVERNKMEGELLESVNKNELYLLYQPKMKKVNDKYEICGMEALMRWKNATWGEVSPNKFIPIAENNGYIENMSRWLIDEVCQKSIAWKALYDMDIPISINLSGTQFLNSKLAEQVLGIINSYGVSSSSIILEITESAIMKEPETAQKIISKFQESGVKISMDDFGTGYSSFSYLSSFKVDELKIDRSFINKMKSSVADKLVVEAIIVMAHKLNLIVVAEGVENNDELNLLVENKCDIYQGYYFSKPLTEENLIKFYKDN